MADARTVRGALAASWSEKGNMDDLSTTVTATRADLERTRDKERSDLLKRARETWAWCEKATPRPDGLVEVTAEWPCREQVQPCGLHAAILALLEEYGAEVEEATLEDYSRVRVFSADKSVDLGEGKIIGWTPLIRLDDGGEIHGYECWWIKKEAAEQIEREAK
jgi:hypothetical protein